MSATFAVTTNGVTTSLTTAPALHEHLDKLTGGPHTLHFECGVCNTTGRKSGAPCHNPMCGGRGRFEQDFVTADDLRAFIKSKAVPST